ncbi:MAG: chromate transporter [Candidatus Eremiobacteraeota bacterium]|nr:chromate transporter [Candidatus Eremiobacteraeota bacterium]
MSDATASGAAPQIAAAAQKVSVKDLFVAFLIIGATSFGGGAVAYLRSTLVAKTKWLDDKSFLELFSISQSLPGLNTTNMAILAGDRLCGWMGALAAVVGVILPGAILMTVAGVLYGMHHERPLVDAALKGVAAGATGLIFATFFQLAGKTMRGWWDLLFLAAAVLLVNRLHVSVLYALIALGIAATIIYRPGGAAERSRAQ